MTEEELKLEISKNPNVIDIAIDKIDDKIDFKYKKIIIKHQQIDYAFENLPIRVTSYFYNGSSNCGLQCPQYNYKHPHIQTGSICLGDHYYIERMLKSDLVSGIKALEVLLSNLGPNPYYRITSFSSELTLCHSCVDYKHDVLKVRKFGMCLECRTKPDPITILTERCSTCNTVKSTIRGKVVRNNFICRSCNEA